LTTLDHQDHQVIANVLEKYKLKQVFTASNLFSDSVVAAQTWSAFSLERNYCSTRYYCIRLHLP